MPRFRLDSVGSAASSASSPASPVSPPAMDLNVNLMDLVTPNSSTSTSSFFPSDYYSAYGTSYSPAPLSPPASTQQQQLFSFPPSPSSYSPSPSSISSSPSHYSNRLAADLASTDAADGSSPHDSASSPTSDWRRVGRDLRHIADNFAVTRPRSPQQVKWHLGERKQPRNRETKLWQLFDLLRPQQTGSSAAFNWNCAGSFLGRFSPFNPFSNPLLSALAVYLWWKVFKRAV